MNIKVIGYGLWVVVALLVSAPVTAQNAQEWQSTSVMQTSGSAYSSQVTEIGATTVSSAVTTTESYSPASGPNRAKKFDTGGDSGQGPSPIGEPWVLAVFALVFGGVIFLRRQVKE